LGTGASVLRASKTAFPFPGLASGTKLKNLTDGERPGAPGGAGVNGVHGLWFGWTLRFGAVACSVPRLTPVTEFDR